MKQGGLRGFRLPAGAPPSGSFDELTLDPNRKYHVTLVLPQYWISSLPVSCLAQQAMLASSIPSLPPRRAPNSPMHLYHV